MSVKNFSRDESRSDTGDREKPRRRCRFPMTQLVCHEAESRRFFPARSKSLEHERRWYATRLATKGRPIAIGSLDERHRENLVSPDAVRNPDDDKNRQTEKLCRIAKARLIYIIEANLSLAFSDDFSAIDDSRRLFVLLFAANPLVRASKATPEPLRVVKSLYGHLFTVVT